MGRQAQSARDGVGFTSIPLWLCGTHKGSMNSMILTPLSSHVSGVQNSSHCGSSTASLLSAWLQCFQGNLSFLPRLHLRLGSFGSTAVPSQACLLGSPSRGSSSAFTVLQFQPVRLKLPRRCTPVSRIVSSREFWFDDGTRWVSFGSDPRFIQGRDLGSIAGLHDVAETSSTWNRSWMPRKMRMFGQWSNLHVVRLSDVSEGLFPMSSSHHVCASGCDGAYEAWRGQKPCSSDDLRFSIRQVYKAFWRPGVAMREIGLWSPCQMPLGFAFPASSTAARAPEPRSWSDRTGRSQPSPAPNLATRVQARRALLPYSVVSVKRLPRS